MKNEIRGWKEVFQFTLIQTLKSKAYLVGLGILLVLALASVPIMSLISGKAKNEDVKNPIEKVYVFNETTLQDLDFADAVKKETVSHITFVKSQESYDSVLKNIEKDEKTSVALKITAKGGAYQLDFVKSTADTVGKKDLESLAEMLGDYFEKYKIEILNMTPEQNAIISAEVGSKITKTDTAGNAITKKNTSISDNEYWIIYAILFVVLMVNSMASSQIATSVVSEKSSKVIEYLLTSVRPLAIIVGKIPAVLITVLIQMISLMLCVLISTLFTSQFLHSDVTEVLRANIPSNVLENINPVNIICSLIVIALGFLFYATLAGLCGATASRMEEAGESLTLFTMTNMIGAYVGLGAANSLMAAGDNVFVTFALLCPLSSPFLVPGAILVGKTSALLLLLAVVLQIVFVVLLFLFVARVYETLILHNGSRIKVKELLQISKNATKKEALKTSGGGTQNE